MNREDRARYLAERLEEIGRVGAQRDLVGVFGRGEAPTRPGRDPLPAGAWRVTRKPGVVVEGETVCLDEGGEAEIPHNVRGLMRPGERVVVEYVGRAWYVASTREFRGEDWLRRLFG